jgi:hypothetical protein
MSKLSVIVCTYKRYDLAENCLAHISQLDFPREDLDVIVIDNTPSEFRRSIDWGSLGADQIKYEEVSGLSRARNRGIEESKSALIAFIDDDAEVSPSWAQHICDTFDANAMASVVGGKVVASYKDCSRPGWMSAKLEGYLSCIDWGGRTRAIEQGEWIVGANMAFRREVFKTHGLFDVSLGRIGHSTLLSNEEIHLFSKLPAESIFYSCEAKVDHLIPVDRISQHWFRKRVFWQAVSDSLAGIGVGLTSSEYFNRFARNLPRIPAEQRSFKALNRSCTTSAEFEEQLEMIYALTMAQGIGLVDIEEITDR